MTDWWGRLQDLFDRAVALEDEAARTALLDREAADDPALRAEVESMLRYSRSAGAVLDRVVGGAVVDLDRQSGLEPGERLGRYTVEREIGRGGSGTVYRAMSEAGPVAIKALWGARWSEEIRSRFRRERRILEQLDHPCLTRVLDSGATDDGVLYEVMEYVEGEPIDTFCERRALDAHDRIRVFLRVCEAVAYAHERGIVHRDLKPGNILVESDGTPKVLDFGIAKPLEPLSTDGTRFSTRTGTKLMTPRYASPEQVRGEPVTPASDVYALGVILYELLTGRLPYSLKGGYPGEVLLAILEEEPEPPSESAPAVSPVYDFVVLRTLEKERSRRFATADDLARALRPAGLDSSLASDRA